MNNKKVLLLLILSIYFSSLGFRASSEGSMYPPSPANLTSTQGNFWINYTWEAGNENVATDSYYVSVNGAWTNGTTDTYSNISVGAHGWSNISVWAYNSSGSGSLSSNPATDNTQVANNIPIQAHVEDQIVNEGDLLTFTISATDEDKDTITYGTNATKGTLNKDTGQFSWIPNNGDAKTYYWYFSSSDGYGGVVSETIKVTVNKVPLSIKSSSPANDPTTIVSTAQKFEVSLNRAAKVIWYINGAEVQTDLNVISASYTNSTAGVGSYNVTAIASDGYDSVSRTWIWTVSPEPKYSVSGYVFDNYGSGLKDVLVLSGNNQTTTSASGYYLINNLLNGTYSFSYSKAGFDTGYLEITINGANIINANKTINDTTPPASVSAPQTTTAVGSFLINNTWISPPDADFSYVSFRYSNGTTLDNVNKPTNHLNLIWSPHYTQNISAQTVDTYGNINPERIWFNATIPNNAPVQALIGNKVVTTGQLLTFTVSATDADKDIITYSTTALKGTLDSSTGVYTWTPTSSDIGTYPWSFSSSDNYGGVDSETITVMVNPPPTYVPPAPANLASTQGNFWINYTWQAGAGNVTDSYNFSVNGAWTNGTTSTYSNISVGAHGWSNISVYAYNNSGGGRLSLTSISQSTQVPNNKVTLGNISAEYTVYENNPVSIYPTWNDLDGDTPEFTSNITKGKFYPNNGTFLWTPSSTESGVYNWYIQVSDGYSTDTKFFTVTVIDTTPTEPTNLSSTIGRFWVNHTWEKGANTDSFNILHNGAWYNGTTNLYFNATVGPHNWSNITVYGYNSLSQQMSNGVSQNIQVPNDPIQLTNVTDNYSLAEGRTLYVDADYIDLDDSGEPRFRLDLLRGDLEISRYMYLKFNVFNRSNFDSKTGILKWTTVDGDNGTYQFQISVFLEKCGCTESATKNFIVTVANSTPAVPVNLSSTTGNFWVNHTWEFGQSTNTFNISFQNGTWNNGTDLPYRNDTVGPHNWSNITVYAWNNTLKKLSSGVSRNTQVPNNIPTVPAKIAPVNWQNLTDGNINLTWGTSTDADGDNITYDWQLSNQADFSSVLKSGSTANHSSNMSLLAGAYYWRVRARDFQNSSDWNASANPDFQIVSAPIFAGIKAVILNDTSVRVEWETDQTTGLNKVEYGYSSDLSGSLSLWNNNTNKPSFTISGLQGQQTGQSIYYKVFSYNSSNLTAYNRSIIFNAYPLHFSIGFIEPGITNGSEKWVTAKVGHIGKYIGVGGNFRNWGPDPLNLTITETYNSGSRSFLSFKPLALNESISYMQLFGRPAFEINSTGVNEGLKVFNFTLSIKDQSSSLFNTTTISLRTYPIFKIKRASHDAIVVREGEISTLTYTLEANSSINLTNVSIYDYNPSKSIEPDKYFDNITLEANKPQRKNYTYPATTIDSTSMRCEESKKGGYPCIINLAIFTAEMNGEIIKDTDYIELPVCEAGNANCYQAPAADRVPYKESGVKSGNNPSGGVISNSGGGGGGGGGMGPSEDFKNIASREVREMSVLAKTVATFVFRSSDPVMVVSFVSSVSEGEVPVAVEVLNNRSKFIDIDAPGNTYKYFNIFVGTSGFNKKVSNGVVVYRVNNSWLEENGLEPKDVSLYKWQEGNWVEKSTEIAESRPNSTYYASMVGSFSSFAIVGVKKQGIGTDAVSNNPLPLDESIKEAIQASDNLNINSSGVGLKLLNIKLLGETLKLPEILVLISGIIGVIYYLKSNHKIKRNGRVK